MPSSPCSQCDGQVREPPASIADLDLHEPGHEGEQPHGEQQRVRLAPACMGVQSKTQSCFPLGMCLLAGRQSRVEKIYQLPEGPDACDTISYLDVSRSVVKNATTTVFPLLQLGKHCGIPLGCGAGWGQLGRFRAWLPGCVGDTSLWKGVIFIELSGGRPSITGHG